MNPCETIEHKGCKIEIFYDEDSQGVRQDYDHLGTMVCWHRQYNLGDVQGHQEYTSREDFLEEFNEKNAILLPLYLYDHSGLTIRTDPFSCPWDSGQVGWIYVTKEKAREEMRVKQLTKAVREKVLKQLRCEVAYYNACLTGNVYGYVTKDQNDEEIDSCWGFYGNTYDDLDWSYMIDCAEVSINSHLESEHLKHMAQIKTWIKNRVPLQYRHA